MEGSMNIDNRKNYFDTNNSTDSFEFGRESLGILPPDFGRESLGFLSSEIERNSLGFSKKSYLEELKNPLEFPNLFQIPDPLNNGRESLGILHFSTLETRFGTQDSKIPDLLLTTSDHENESVCDIFNEAFLLPTPRKFSVASTCSYVSFNANSIEEPSKIFSVPSPTEDVFSNSALYSIPLRLNKSGIDNKKGCTRHRIQSLPLYGNKLDWNKNADVDMTDNSNSCYKIGSLSSLLNKGQLISESELASQVDIEITNDDYTVDKNSLKEHQNNEIASKSQYNNVNQEGNSITENDKICQDSFFIEGKYFADKFANGSILNESFQDEIGVLDNVPHPNWQEFKSPGKDVVTNIQQKVTRPEIDVALNQVSNGEVPITIESDTDHFVSSKIDQTPKRARELLHNLSEILNNTTRSDQQRSEGQHLLNSLAELLSDGSNVRSTNLDDSGHSSFINESSDPEKHYSDMSDFNKKNCSVPDSTKNSINKSLNHKDKTKLGTISSNRLSLSLNSAIPAKVTQHSLLRKTNLSRISLDSNKNRTGSSNSSIKSDNTSSGSILGSSQQNLKLKTNKDVLRRGPLKAMIPVNELKKKAKTPDKTESGIMMQSKRTSTPINEPKLKPVAASTPTSTQPAFSRSNSAEMNGRKSVPSSSKMGISSGTKSNLNVPCPVAGNNVKTRKSLPLYTSPLAKNSNFKKQDSNSEKVQKNSKLSFKDKLPSPCSKQSSTANVQENQKRRNSIGAFKKDQLPSPCSKPSSTLNVQGNEKRRNSISAIKKDHLPQRPRSNSCSKEPVGIMSSIRKIRENLLNSPEFKKISNKSLLKDTSNTKRVVDEASSSGYKGDLLPIAKKLGKENMGK